MNATVVVLRATPNSVLDDYRRLMHLAAYDRVIDRARETLVKLNLSWTKYFPACSSQPWQLEGVIRTLLEDGFASEKLFVVENKTVVTNPWEGAKHNLWLPVLQRYGLDFLPLTEVEWEPYRFRKPLLKLHEIFPQGIWIPKLAWAPMACRIYHDLLWYPLIGRARLRVFRRTAWGELWERYRESPVCH